MNHRGNSKIRGKVRTMLDFWGESSNDELERVRKRTEKVNNSPNKTVSRTSIGRQVDDPMKSKDLGENLDKVVDLKHQMEPILLKY